MVLSNIFPVAGQTFLNRWLAATHRSLFTICPSLIGQGIDSLYPMRCEHNSVSHWLLRIELLLVSRRGYHCKLRLTHTTARCLSQACFVDSSVLSHVVRYYLLPLSVRLSISPTLQLFKYAHYPFCLIVDGVVIFPPSTPASHPVYSVLGVYGTHCNPFYLNCSKALQFLSHSPNLTLIQHVDIFWPIMPITLTLDTAF